MEPRIRSARLPAASDSSRACRDKSVPKEGQCASLRHLIHIDRDAGRELRDVQRKEVVIENDIAWRINATVDFLFGKPISFVSRSPDNRKRAEIESILEENFEFIKALDEALLDKKHTIKGDLRIIYYDEGFHKLLGQLYYLIFAVNEYGEPIQVDIQSTRDMRVIRDCLEQTISKMGGVDMIVSDGSPTVLRAVRSLRKSIILVQQIHSSKGKRVEIMK
ncbi:hypothetical protein LCGC14_2799420 [marine sediment metagenome]|uniref:DDE domain-containing protein n=1 Tax=marine sediment metagenome TaxID=412755 RepID=A0A0F8ZA68_9ZZZZ